MIGRTPYAFAVYPGLGVKNILDLVKLAKSKPGELNYSSIGEGSVAHLGMVVFAEKMGLDLHHVPYKSTAQSISSPTSIFFTSGITSRANWVMLRTASACGMPA